MRDVGSPWLRICLDPADLTDPHNFDASLLHVVQVHARMRDVGDDGADLAIHWPGLLQNLQLARYRGFCLLDYEGVEDPEICGAAGVALPPQRAQPAARQRLLNETLAAHAPGWEGAARCGCGNEGGANGNGPEPTRLRRAGSVPTVARTKPTRSRAMAAYRPAASSGGEASVHHEASRRARVDFGTARDSPTIRRSSSISANTLGIGPHTPALERVYDNLHRSLRDVSGGTTCRTLARCSAPSTTSRRSSETYSVAPARISRGSSNRRRIRWLDDGLRRLDLTIGRATVARTHARRCSRRSTSH